MKNLLENVIKAALFESRTVGIVKSVTQNELRDAQGKGTVWLYAVLTKRTAVPAEVLNIVYGATLANSSTDEGNRVAIGPGSKFSNGEFIYVVGMPAPIQDNDRRQLIPVSIVKRGKNQITNAKMIGKSPMLTQEEYDVERAKDQSLVDTSNNDAKTTGEQIQQVIDKGLNALGIDGNKKDEPTPTPTPADDKNKTTADPNVYAEKNGVKVYTMAPTDPYVYAKINGVWMYAKKADFDKQKDTVEYSKIFTMRLNKAGIAKVEARFGLAAAAQGGGKTQSGGGSGTQGGGTQGGGTQTESGLVKGKMYGTDFTKVGLYYFKDNQWMAAGEADVTKADSFKFIQTSSDSKYNLFQLFDQSNKAAGTFWIKSSVKFKEKAAPLTPGATMRWTTEAVSGGVPTYRDGGKEATGNRITVKATDKVTYVSKNSAGTFYQIKHNGVNIWVPKRYVTR